MITDFNVTNLKLKSYAYIFIMEYHMVQQKNWYYVRCILQLETFLK